MTWALIDGCFVVADVLSLAAIQPEGRRRLRGPALGGERRVGQGLRVREPRPGRGRR